MRRRPGTNPGPDRREAVPPLRIPTPPRPRLLHERWRDLVPVLANDRHVRARSASQIDAVVAVHAPHAEAGSRADKRRAIRRAADGPRRKRFHLRRDRVGEIRPPKHRVAGRGGTRRPKCGSCAERGERSPSAGVGCAGRSHQMRLAEKCVAGMHHRATFRCTWATWRPDFAVDSVCTLLDARLVPRACRVYSAGGIVQLADRSRSSVDVCVRSNDSGVSVANPSASSRTSVPGSICRSSIESMPLQ